MSEVTDEELPEVTDEELRLLIQKVARRIRSNRGDQRLTDAQLGVLSRLSEIEALTPGALADLERVTPPSMNRTVNALERAGLVRRDKDRGDARRVLVRITPSGHDAIAETRRVRRVWFSEHLATLTPDQRRRLEAAIPVLRTLAES